MRTNLLRSTWLKAMDRKLLRDLWQMRGQVVAILLIVSCGIASLVTMSSTYDSLSLTQSTYYERYRFADVFVQLKRAPESLMARVQAIPGVQQSQSRVVMDVTLDVPGLAEPATGRLVSIPEQQRTMLNDIYLREGRYLEPGHRDEVLVSEVFAQANHLGLGDELGAVINGRWQNLHIVGIALSPEYVYEIRGTELVPDNQRFGVLWMGREALGTAFEMEGGFNDLSLTLMPGANEQEVIFQLDHLLERYGGLGAYGRKLQISNQFVSDEIRQLSAHAVLMPTIFLGIAVFLLNLLLGRLVSTQRDQIAVMKAFGYSNIEVGLHYLKLVLVVVLIGAVLGTGLGICLGLLMSRFYTHFYHFPILTYRAEGRVISTAVVVSATAAIAAAFMAVQRAVQLPPAEAMRPEPPASYRPTLVERLGLQRLFSPSSRIILRNLERRPWQALMSVVGIATAIAILVVGRYFEDAMAHIVEIQFRTGKTRVKERYIVSAPVTGRLGRIDLDAGDPISLGQALGRIDPLPYSSEVKAAQAKLQELQAQLSGVETQRPKSAALSQAQAEIVAAQADQQEAQAEVARVQAALDQARRDRQRAQTLEQQGAITRNAREDAELLENTRTRELEAAQQRVQRAIADVVAAQEASRLLLAEQQDPDYLLQVYQAQIASAQAELANLADEASRTAITAPAGGQVLRLWQTSARFVQAGEPLLEIGEPADQELVVDLLSSDAVKVELDDPIHIIHWGGEQPLVARVQAIEPSAFTEVSALGVEEQRVNIIGNFVGPVPLGDGYRVEAEVVIQDAKNVVKVPVSALFRCDANWCVFTEDAHRAKRQEIHLGQRNAFEAEVLGGLVVGDRVILHPTEQIEPEKRIKQR